jgi:hypothetical protein
MPDLPDVKRALAEAEDKIKNPPPQPFPWAIATGVVSAVSLGVFGLMFGLRWKRNRFRVGPAQVVKLIEEGTPPVILDVRQESAYATSPFRIAGALHVSPDELETGVASLAVEPERTVVAYCT